MPNARHSAWIAAVALVLAGCGGNGGGPSLSKAEYERRATPIVTEAASDILKLSLAISRAPAPRLAIARIHTLRSDLRTAASRLEALAPPAEAEPSHDSMVAGLREAADDLDRFEREARTSPSQRMLGFFEEFRASPGVQKLSRALEDLRAKGYRVGPLE